MIFKHVQRIKIHFLCFVLEKYRFYVFKLDGKLMFLLIPLFSPSNFWLISMNFQFRTFPHIFQILSFQLCYFFVGKSFFLSHQQKGVYVIYLVYFFLQNQMAVLHVTALQLFFMAVEQQECDCVNDGPTLQ